MRGTAHVISNDGLEFNLDKTKIGMVTSGGYSPTLKAPIAMGYINEENIKENDEVLLSVRGKLIPASITNLPFVKHNYYRGKNLYTARRKSHREKCLCLLSQCEELSGFIVLFFSNSLPCILWSHLFFSLFRSIMNQSCSHQHNYIHH